MDFDFAGLYHSYTNIELLKIIRHPEKFQDEAVAAASAILETRSVTDEEREAAGFIIKKSEAVSNSADYGQDVLESFNPDMPRKESILFIVCFSLICIYYLRYSYYCFRSLLLTLRYGYFSFMDFFYPFFYLLVIPATLYGFYKKRQLTWYILIADNALRFSLFTASLIDYKVELTHLSLSQIFILISVVLRPVIIYFLMQPQITGRVNISADRRKKTLLAIAGLFIIIIALDSFFKSGKTL